MIEHRPARLPPGRLGDQVEGTGTAQEGKEARRIRESFSGGDGVIEAQLA